MVRWRFEDVRVINNVNTMLQHHFVYILGKVADVRK